MNQRNLNTGFIFFPAFDWSLGLNHPEREERLLYTKDLLEEEGIFDLPVIQTLNPREVAQDEISPIHIGIPKLAHHTTPAHFIAVGGILELADWFMNKRIRNGFAAIRPPGHHANRIVYGNRGFCSINNVAILTQYLRHRYNINRIAIVDTDVHHGDGTQNIFWHDPDVLFISLHQDGRTQYPGTGFLAEAGGPAAFGSTINLPLPPGAGDQSFLSLINTVIRPILADFKPEIIINSAGQDCHFTDPLGRLQVTAAGYAEATQLLNPDLIILEGGYAIESALPYTHLAMILALAGLPYQSIREPDLKYAKLVEPSGCKKYIDHLTEQALKLYFHREEIKYKMYPMVDSSHTRDLRIYYDTDGILDMETEELMLCSQCPGWLKMTSKAHFGTGGKILTEAVVLLHQSCARCRSNAELTYQEKLNRAENINFIAWQDLKNNQCLVNPIH